MPKKIPIKIAKSIGQDYDYNQVIVWAFNDDGTQHITTWGKTLHDCDTASIGGNRLKEQLGWPETLHTQPSRVTKLQTENKDLKGRITQLENNLKLYINI